MVRLLVAQAIVSRAPDDFAALLRSVPGLPPEIALSVLRELVVDGELVTEASRLVSSAQSPIERVDDPIERVLMAPHPLDHEWRFDVVTRLRLARLLAETSGPQGHVAALGCPTVAYELMRATTSPRVTLIDANPGLPLLSDEARYTQISADLRAGLPPDVAMADVAIADPPFYPDEVSSFISTASALVRNGGYLYLALFPATTRPSAQDDVARAIALANDLGWRLVEVQPASLGYRRPRFERNAHEALGLHGVPDDWRKADLYIFERTSVSTPTPNWSFAPFPSWEEVIVGATRVRVLFGEAAPDVAIGEVELLEEVVPGDVLDSVSGRDPRRALANVWTDGNVVWATRRPSMLLAILRAAAAQTDPLEAAIAQCELEGVRLDRSPLKVAVAEVLRRVNAII